jgi:autotransporter family porin
LNSGLRAIQGANQNGNGSSGKIEIKDTLDMILTGARIEGIYVSGAASNSAGTEAVSQVVLNDTTLKW